MGAWSEGTFGNDTACDWTGDFLEDPGMHRVLEAINAVRGEDEYLDRDPACECLAACEVLARLQGNWGTKDAYSEDLDAWILANPMDVSDDIKRAADAAIERILGRDSELADLWDEDGRNDAWHATVDDLRRRVQG